MNKHEPNRLIKLMLNHMLNSSINKMFKTNQKKEFFLVSSNFFLKDLLYH